MKEDLNFKGNQLNQINTVFTVGYVVDLSKSYTGPLSKAVADIPLDKYRVIWHFTMSSPGSFFHL